jgi:hypothetical protein
LIYVFEDNGSFLFEFVDLAGNTGSYLAVVDRIDKTSPIVTGFVTQPV